MLTLLPDLTYPITSKQADALMNNMVQLNLIEAHLNEKQQRGLGLLLHLIDVFVKSGGRIDYRGLEGHRRMVDDAMSLAGRGMGNRLGDLEACHLALDYSDCQLRLKSVGQPPISSDVNILLRMAGQTMEHLLLTCTNLPEVIWHGSQGELIVPEFSHDFAAESTLHYKSNGEGWKVLRVPDEIMDKVMIYRGCFEDGAYHFPPGCNDEVGVVIGQGDSIEESIDDLKENFSALENEPVSINEHAFVKLLEEIEEGEREGVEFSDQTVPEPEQAL